MDVDQFGSVGVVEKVRDRGRCRPRAARGDGREREVQEARETRRTRGEPSIFCLTIMST